MVGIERASEVQLFQGVDTSLLEYLLHKCSTRILKDGEVLLSPRQENKLVYLVLSGRLGIHLESPDAPPITCIEQGESVGELSVISNQSTSSFVVGSGESELLILTQDQLWFLINSSHVAARNLLFILSIRVRLSNEVIREGKKRQRVFEEFARRDALTGICNRDALNKALDSKLEGSSKSGNPFSFLILDVDHFKQYNDTHGHLCGDCALVKLARTIDENVRPNDFVARYGGEEFAAILPNTESEEAEKLANHLRIAVSQAEVVFSEEKVLPSITVSVGLAESRPGESATELIARADAALYRAKRSGRNRACR